MAYPTQELDLVLLEAHAGAAAVTQAAAERAGCRVVSGLELLLTQGVRQFALYTGVPAPVEAMRAALIAAAARR